MFFVLDDAQRTLNPELDRRHQHLLDLVNAVVVSDAAPQLERALEAIRATAVAHFVAEERVMAGMGFPRRGGHIRQHEAISAWLAGLQHAASMGMNPLTVQLGLHDGIERRLLRHVQRADRRLAQWLQRQRWGDLETRERELWETVQELAAK